MIVFSATYIATGNVFVGSARQGLESEWAQLISQSDDGAEGSFFTLLRKHGPAAFVVDEYAYADNAAELRALTREAREELGAELIKNSRSDSAKRIGSGASMSMVDIMATIEAVAQEVDAELKKLDQSEDKPVAKPLSTAQELQASQLIQPSVTSSGITTTLDSAPTEVATQASSIADASVTPTLAEQKSLRHTHDRANQAEMNAVIAKIEQRRSQSRKATPKTNAKLKSKAVSAQQKSASEDKSPLGKALSVSAKRALDQTLVRTTTSVSTDQEALLRSSSKEKRIQDAIAHEQKLRQTRRREKTMVQAHEMATLVDRLEQRTKGEVRVKKSR